MWSLSFRPSTLYQRLSEAHRSTKTTLLLSMPHQIHQGKTSQNTNILNLPSLAVGNICCVHRPAIVVLLMSMVNERQPFVLRCAVLYCFQCFLYKNQKGQGEIVATLLPSTIDGKLIYIITEAELSVMLHHQSRCFVNLMNARYLNSLNVYRSLWGQTVEIDYHQRLQ